MKTKNFLASCAKATFALATVVMMSAMLTSCSKDNDDNNGELPEAKPNTVVIDGKERPVLSAQYEDRRDNDYGFFLYLDAAHKEYVYFSINSKVHLTGKPIDLTKKEPKHDGYYWWISYAIDSQQKFVGVGAPLDTERLLFNTGTVTFSGKPEGTISIKVANGRIMGKEDKKEHTLTVRYVGTAEKK